MPREGSALSPADRTIVVERRIAASPATVFRFLTDAERWLSWQGTEATLDPRPGGVFRMSVRGDAIASGTFLEVVRDRRVVFTWGWEGSDHPVPPGSTTVAIDLEPDGDGTLLRLTHSDLPPSQDEHHRGGWERYLDRLVVRAEGGDPGPDPSRVASPDS